MSKTPAPSTTVALDLDTLERDETPDPFVITLAGRDFTLRDPGAMQFGELAENTDPRDFLALTVERADRDAFARASRDLPAWKIKRLSDAYRDHYREAVEKFERAAAR